MASIREVLNTDDIVVVTEGGMVIRQHASDVRIAGRNTQGVRLIRLQGDYSVADVAVVVAEEEEEKKIAEATEPTEKPPAHANIPSAGSADVKAKKPPLKATSTPPTKVAATTKGKSVTTPVKSKEPPRKKNKK